MIRRAGVGLARLGSFWGNGSGDVFVGFTTANRTPHEAKTDLLAMQMLAESKIDALFQATADVTQEAVLDALAAVDGENVEIGLTDSNSSCLIRSPASAAVRYVVMPMRL